MPIEIEPLDLTNVIEIQKIRELLVNHPDLLSMLVIDEQVAVSEPLSVSTTLFPNGSDVSGSGITSGL